MEIHVQEIHPNPWKIFRNPKWSKHHLPICPQHTSPCPPACGKRWWELPCGFLQISFGFGWIYCTWIRSHISTNKLLSTWHYRTCGLLKYFIYGLNRNTNEPKSRRICLPYQPIDQTYYLNIKTSFFGNSPFLSETFLNVNTFGMFDFQSNKFIFGFEKLFSDC